MAFRAAEAAADGLERLKTYFIHRNFSADDRARSERALMDIVERYGPVVDSYPTWHPLVRNKDGRDPNTTPENSYDGRLDHTQYFANAFITCPYGDVSQIIASANEARYHEAYTISAEQLDVKLYADNAKPILVRCDWSLDPGNMVPKKFAIPLMLEQELPCWRWAEVAETWETMRPYLLGRPHGNLSSLFVTQDTALALKKTYLALVDSGMFGSLRK